MLFDLFSVDLNKKMSGKLEKIADGMTWGLTNVQGIENRLKKWKILD